MEVDDGRSGRVRFPCDVIVAGSRRQGATGWTNGRVEGVGLPLEKNHSNGKELDENPMRNTGFHQLLIVTYKKDD